jgi:tetratricopeptide (TPR) repeat protein
VNDADVPLISLSSANSESANDPPMYISNAEMLDLYNEHNNREGEVEDTLVLRQMGRLICSPTSPNIRQGNPELPSFFDSDFTKQLFSRFSTGAIGDPINEIYPFPSPPTVSTYSMPDIETSLCLTPLRFIEAIDELKTKLRTFKRMLGAKHLTTIATMQDLADIYFEHHKFCQAEYWYRQVVTAKETVRSTKPLEILWDALQVIKVLLAQGKYLQAKNLHRDIHSTIIKTVDPTHDLALESTAIMADVLGRLGNSEEAESLNRQLLQIALTNFGPRDLRTASIMEYLASFLIALDRPITSEQLLRTALQLRRDMKRLDELILCNDLRILASALKVQGRDYESLNLARHTAEQSKLIFGSEHPETLRCSRTLASCLRTNGFLEESKQLLQSTLSIHLSVLGERHRSTRGTMWQLAETLTGIDCNSEALTWYEKVFWICVEEEGLDCRFVISHCRELGRCYESLGRYADALALYQQTINKIRSEMGEEHPAILRIQPWIDWVLGVLEGEGNSDSEMEEDSE